jgi:hypothetical protein
MKVQKSNLGKHLFDRELNLVLLFDHLLLDFGGNFLSKNYEFVNFETIVKFVI